MKYLTGYTEQEADYWGSVFLGMAREQLGTDAITWGKIQLADGTWVVPLDEVRQSFVTVPAELQQRLADRISEGRLKTYEELDAMGLWPVSESTDSR